MNGPRSIERSLITDPRQALFAHQLSGVRIPINLRRQDKVIAAIVRHDPQLLLRDSVAITPHERRIFQERAANKRVDVLTDSKLESVLSALPIPIDSSPDQRNPVQIFNRFHGDNTLNRRMRRVVSYVIRGTLEHPETVTPNDLYTFVRKRCRTAIAFERMIPQILQATDRAELGSQLYAPVLHEVGLTLYGNQWVYLQQARLAETHAKSLIYQEDRLNALRQRIPQRVPPQRSPVQTEHPTRDWFARVRNRRHRA